MSGDGRLEKMERDFTGDVDALLPVVDNLAKNGKLVEAIEQLSTLEKQARSAADMTSTSRLLVYIIELCAAAQDWKAFNEQIVILSKKRGQLKQAITKMIQHAVDYVDKTPDMITKLELIETLRQVTEGKIYVEVERARLTRKLSKIREEEGKFNEAADILHELQVETFGSMEKREKADFILEQMRLGLIKKDYVRTQIISRKISPKLFKSDEFQDLKIRYYTLMVELSLHDYQYLNTCKYFRQIYDTKLTQDNSSKWKEVLQSIVSFVVLAPFDNEQHDLINIINTDKNIELLPLFKQLLNCFITPELMRWPKIEEIYRTTLLSTFVFDGKTEQGAKRWKDLHDRVIEHNIRVISKYYTKITIKRLTELLDLNHKDAEEFLSKLVVNKTIYARIDRLAGVVDFVPRRSSAETLNEWSSDINELLRVIVKTNHLITKEEMVHKIAQVK